MNSPDQVTPNTPTVVDRPDELTPEWMTAALRSGGRAGTVTEAWAEPIGTGQMGATYRVHLTYAGTPGPATVVVKLAAGDDATRAMISPGYRAEVGFLTEIAPGLDVRMPECHFGAIVKDGTRFTIVMADQADAIPGVQADGCSEAAAQAAIDNLVGLHAPRWNDPTLFGLRYLGRPNPAMAKMMGRMCVSAVGGFVDRYQDHLAAAEQAILVEAAARVEVWQVTRPEPFSVIHGDYRLDNLLFTPSGEVVAVDWQTAAIGPPLRDVAYFLGTCVDTDQRRATEADLVRRYHAALVGRGITDYPFEQCWDDYRLGMIQGPMVTILGCMHASGERTEKSDGMFLAMSRRSSAAIADLGVLDLLPASS